MTRETRLGMAVTVEAEVMESRLDGDLDVGCAAAMAMDAGIETAAIGIVMVADETVDGHVLAVIEIQRQRLRTAQQRFTQREACAARDERSERKDRRGDDAGNERRVTPEGEPAHGGRVWRRRGDAPAPEEQGDAPGRDGDEQQAPPDAGRVAAGRDHMGREQRYT